MLYCLMYKGVIQFDKAGQMLIIINEQSAVNSLVLYPDMVVAPVGLTFPQ